MEDQDSKYRRVLRCCGLDVALPTGVTRPRCCSPNNVDNLTARDYVLRMSHVNPSEMSPAWSGPAPKQKLSIPKKCSEAPALVGEAERQKLAIKM